jgi:uncharacterized protein YdbL (DUF1318 family)
MVASPPREATPETVSRLANKVISLAQKLDRKEVLLKQAQRINSSITHIVSTAEELNAAQQELAAAMQDVVRLADQASVDVTSTNHILTAIHRISSRTNILGLNASIEAARVGEQGSGFAVVAEDVQVQANSVIYHTNHYVGEQMSQYNQYIGKSSKLRYERIGELLSGSTLPYNLDTFITFSHDKNAGDDNSIFRQSFRFLPFRSDGSFNTESGIPIIIGKI